MMPNQNPEQIARDNIDVMLRAAGWSVQNKDDFDFRAGEGQAIREYQTDTGPADYVLFVDRKPVGVIEARKETPGQNITLIEEQTGDYSVAKIKWIQSIGDSLPSLYKATDAHTRLTGQPVPQGPKDDPATELLSRIRDERGARAARHARKHPRKKSHS